MTLIKQHLADIAWGMYTSPTGVPSIIKLMLKDDSILFNSLCPFKEIDMVEPITFFNRLDNVITGNKKYPSTLKKHAINVKMIFQLNLDQMPLYLNNPSLKSLAIWRLKNNL